MKTQATLKFPDIPHEVLMYSRVPLLLRFKDAVGLWFNKLVNRLGLPGAIADTEIDDELSGLSIRVKRGVFFTRISVNGRDFYFRRFSGKFDGTGSGCNQSPRRRQAPRPAGFEVDSRSGGLYPLLAIRHRISVRAMKGGASFRSRWPSKTDSS